MMQVIVDRIEKEKIVVELSDGTLGFISINILPAVVEGDVVEIFNNSSKTLKRQREMEKLMENLFED